LTKKQISKKNWYIKWKFDQRFAKSREERKLKEKARWKETKRELQNDPEKRKQKKETDRRNYAQRKLKKALATSLSANAHQQSNFEN
jgi:hypothetical protein